MRVEHAQKLVDLVSDDYKSTVAVDAILTGTGRVPNDACLEHKFTIPPTRRRASWFRTRCSSVASG